MPILNCLTKLHIESYRDEIGLAKKSVSHDPSYYSGGMLAPFHGLNICLYVCMQPRSPTGISTLLIPLKLMKIGYKFDDDKVSVFPKDKLGALDGSGEVSSACVRCIQA